ncbi:MAG TPA: ParA family protein [Beijerinckiaceae bacterium]|nr:ParA family protein [Beijerinckiaceae bacterium]
MRTIAFVTQKGGSGKSTLCINLSVAAQQAGRTVCILEMDRQATVSDWAEQRDEEGPEVAQVDATQVDAVIARLKGSGYDFVFIDTPGIDSAGTLSAIRNADLCVIPCRPTPADLRAFKPTLAAIYRLDKRFAFVLNQTPPRSYRVRDAADGLAVLGVVPDVNIVLRNDHQDAIGVGKGVTELNPDGPASQEIRQLWSWIEKRMKLGASPSLDTRAPATSAKRHQASRNAKAA